MFGTCCDEDMKIGFHQVGREIEDSELVEEAFDPCSVEGFGHIQGNGADQSPLVKVGYWVGDWRPYINHAEDGEWKVNEVINNAEDGVLSNR
jgi:hypothetical protein